MEERIHLIPKEKNFYSYFFLTKDIIDVHEYKCEYCIFFSCCFPFALVTDTIIFIPQCLANNIELCFK